MVMIMMRIMATIFTSPQNPRSAESTSDQTIITTTSTTTFCPTWKLYENPFYYSHHQQKHTANCLPRHQHHHQQQQPPPQQQEQEEQNNHKQLHKLHLPVSARKIAASFWDLTFVRPIMDSELDIARAQIIELKAELEHQRKARKKMESLKKRLARELSEERKGREALERVCEELAKEVSVDKSEISRMKKEMEGERKMLRLSEVFREERVQMKLNEAKLLLEEKILELEVTKRMQTDCALTSKPESTKNHEEDHNVQRIVTPPNAADSFLLGEPVRRCLAVEKSKSGSSTTGDNSTGIGHISSTSVQRRASPEPENPHIRRGIKGFVEFPKVVRAIRSKGRHLGTKSECQKAQLRILLKQKNPIRSSNLII